MCYLVAVQARQRPARSLASRLVGSLYPLNRSDNVIGQEFRKIVGGAEVAYQWVILWNGVCNVARITDGCEKIFATLRRLSIGSERAQRSLWPHSKPDGGNDPVSLPSYCARIVTRAQ